MKLQIPDNIDEIQRDAMEHGYKWIQKDGEWTVIKLADERPVVTGHICKYEYIDGFFTCPTCRKQLKIGV